MIKNESCRDEKLWVRTLGNSQEILAFLFRFG